MQLHFEIGCYFVKIFLWDIVCIHTCLQFCESCLLDEMNHGLLYLL